MVALLTSFEIEIEIDSEIVEIVEIVEIDIENLLLVGVK